MLLRRCFTFFSVVCVCEALKYLLKQIFEYSKVSIRIIMTCCFKISNENKIASLCMTYLSRISCPSMSGVSRAI